MDFQVLKDSVYSSPAFVLDEIEMTKAVGNFSRAENAMRLQDFIFN